MSGTAPRIFEIALFWNEDIIFRERILNTLEYADFFYVAEGNESHSGHLKRDHFQFPELLKKLAASDPKLDLSRVIFVPVDLAKAGTNPGERERLVRDAAFQKLKADTTMRRNDILLIQDFDEFFKSDQRNTLFRHFTGIYFWRKVMRLKYRMTYYQLNLEEQNAPWDLVLAVKGDLALRPRFSPNFFRHSIRKKKFKTTRESLGWHHSYLGSSEKVLEKIRSFAEAHIPLVKDASEDEILARISRGEDLFGRDFKYQKIDYAKSAGIPALMKREDLMLK